MSKYDISVGHRVLDSIGSIFRFIVWIIGLGVLILISVLMYNYSTGYNNQKKIMIKNKQVKKAEVETRSDEVDAIEYGRDRKGDVKWYDFQ